ncbi:MAG: hypothetical protein ACUZ8I_12310 [Candidatus Scalindua sp.]
MAEHGAGLLGFNSDALVSEIFRKNPGFEQFLNPEDVMFTTSFDLGKRGFAEVFDKDESGSLADPRPLGTEGKFAVEFRDFETFSDPIRRESLATLELLHALPFSKTFKPLTDKFKNTFTEEQNREFKKEARGRDLDEFLDSVIIPRFLRGAFNTLPDEALDDFSGFAKSFRGQKRFPGIAELFNSEQRQIVSEIGSLLKRKQVNPAGLLSN